MLHVKHLLPVLGVGLSVVLLGCESSPPRGRSQTVPTDAPTTAVLLPPTDPTPPDVRGETSPADGSLPETAPSPGRDDAPSPWWDAYNDRPLSGPEEDALLLRLAAPEGDTRRAAAMALARRGALGRIEATRARIPPPLLDDYLRGLHGRPRELVPTGWQGLQEYTGSAEHRLLALSAWSRLSLPLPINSRGWAVSLLASARPDEQRVGARLLGLPDAPLPSTGVSTGVGATAAPVMARVLAGRPDLPRDHADLLVRAWSERAALQPRDWATAVLVFAQHLSGPAAAPLSLPGALRALQTALIDDPRVLSRFRCRVAVQRVRLGDAASVEGCGLDASDGFEALAAVEASRFGPAATRVGLYRALLGSHARQPRVLIAVAEALGDLTPAQALPLLRELGAVGDPGVTAALLQTMMLHVQHFRALRPAEQRDILERALRGEERDFLEARIAALRLARMVGIRVEAPSSTIREVQRAAIADAGIEARPAPQGNAPGQGHRLVIETRGGRVVIDTADSSAPSSVATVLEAARQRMYDGTRMHRVVPGFVAQGGDPRGDGYGGTIRVTPTEVGPGRFDRGAVGVALAGADTGGMQWFVVLADAPHLDARYPYLGRVVEGMEVVDRWMEEETLVRVTVE